jgi:hypothetical protein
LDKWVPVGLGVGTGVLLLIIIGFVVWYYMAPRAETRPVQDGKMCEDEILEDAGDHISQGYIREWKNFHGIWTYRDKWRIRMKCED